MAILGDLSAFSQRQLYYTNFLSFLGTDDSNDFNVVHQNFATNYDEQSCPFCHRYIFNDVSLKRHIELHLKAKWHGYQCNVCMKVYSSKYYIKEHKRTVHNTND